MKNLAIMAAQMFSGENIAEFSNNQESFMSALERKFISKEMLNFI